MTRRGRHDPDDPLDDLDDAPRERTRALHELARARRYLEVLRTLYLVGSVMFALPILLITLELHWATVHTLLLVAISLCFVGGVRIFREPRTWSLVVALVASGVVLGMVLRKAQIGGEVEIGLFDGWAILVALGFWIGVPQARKAARLAEEHPDLYGARLMRGEAGEGRFHAEAKEKARRRLILGSSIAGGVVAVIALLAWAPWAGTPDDARSEGSWSSWDHYARRAPAAPPGPLDPAVARFADAWARSDVSAVDALRHEETRERQAELFRRILTKRGWTEKLPPLLPAEPDKANKGYRALVYFPFADQPDDRPLKTTWEWDGTTWRLAGMSFPSGD